MMESLETGGGLVLLLNTEAAGKSLLCQFIPGGEVIYRHG